MDELTKINVNTVGRVVYLSVLYQISAVVNARVGELKKEGNVNVFFSSKVFQVARYALKTTVCQFFPPVPHLAWFGLVLCLSGCAA